MQIKVAFLLASMLLASPVIASQPTELSSNAAKLHIGLDRPHVIALIGRPTWAAIPKDTGNFKLSDGNLLFSLYWKNRPCSPVVVDFNVSGKVVGWDEGRAICGDEVQRFKLEPSTSQSCKRSDRARLCR